jgi:capsule polysaccharide export protein KpsE/RkpR
LEYPNKESGLATTPELEQGNMLELKAARNGHLMEPIEAAWLLWGKRRFLLRLTVVGLALATLIAFLLPKWYTATTKLMPPNYSTNSALALALPALSGGSGSGGSTGSSITGLASKLLGMNSSGDLYIGVLRSRTIEDHIIQRFGLRNLYHARYPSDARKKLAGLTYINSDANTGIITLSVEDKDPKRAAAMAQAYITELNKVLATVNTSSAHRERVFLEQRLATVKAQMEKASKEFSQFASKNAAIDIPAQAKAMVTAAAELQGQLIAAQAQLRGLEQIYTDKNSRIRQMKALIGELQHQINKFGGKDVNPSNGTTLGKNELYPSVRQLPLLGVKYLDLYRENKIDEAVFELLTKEYEIAKLEEARDLPTAEVLDPAIVPQKKSSPHRLYIMLSGMCFTFVLGVGWILGKSTWECVDPQQPWKILGQEVYGTCKNHPAAVRVSRGVDRAVSIFRRNHNSNGTGA